MGYNSTKAFGGIGLAMLRGNRTPIIPRLLVLLLEVGHDTNHRQLACDEILWLFRTTTRSAVERFTLLS